MHDLRPLLVNWKFIRYTNRQRILDSDDPASKLTLRSSENRISVSSLEPRRH
ncbi:hypothetical protein HMPREF1051_1771 [Neisseria sicca VK64]|uniref:Uncharacterized protein n=1 Tax=Neisseria sicca VK64 TaxID=1095748 RepID=I2NII2_NEISI|nr:hypothetical protein HMPREF1051_1771 [Neisseria sicca VK64]